MHSDPLPPWVATSELFTAAENAAREDTRPPTGNTPVISFHHM